MDDQTLQDAASRFGRTVFGAQLLGDDVGDRTDAEMWPAYIPRPRFAVATGDADSERPGDTYLGASFPYEFVISDNATLAFVNQLNDDDGVFRRYRLLNYHLDQPIPALGLAPVVASSQSPLTLDFRNRQVAVGDLAIPLDGDGKVLLKYTSKWDAPTGEYSTLDPATRNTFFARELIFSAADLLAGFEPAIDPGALAGKHILVGLSASGLLDLRPTPLTGRAPGVIVHATILDNLLSGEFMRDLPLMFSILLLVVLTIGAAEVASLADKIWLEAVVIVLFLAVTFGLGFWGYLVGYWIQLVVPLISVVVALAGANVANFATEGAAKRQIRGMFGRYLSPAVIAQLEANPENLELGGEEREISIFFSDIQKFSTISKDLVVRYGNDGARQLTSFINDYLTPMTDIILEEGGTIDKYEGDAIIAFWGAPVEQPDHAQRAVRAVMRCQAALDELRPQFLERVGKEVYQRIGINTGIATVGNMGSRQRFDYTMIGDSVNLAARLEGANKAFGTYTMVAEDTIKQSEGLYPAREMGNIGVVGREDEPVRIFEPMQNAEYEKRSGALKLFGQALQLFYQGEFAPARSIFARIADADPVAASYLPRCDTLIADPPADWNGVWVLTEKG